MIFEEGKETHALFTQKRVVWKKLSHDIGKGHQYFEDVKIASSHVLATASAHISYLILGHIKTSWVAGLSVHAII